MCNKCGKCKNTGYSACPNKCNGNTKVKDGVKP